ncbi:MAG: hypothetical protein ACR2RF_25245 [Geminicoccaceae bacterium]
MMKTFAEFVANRAQTKWRCGQVAVSTGRVNSDQILKWFMLNVSAQKQPEHTVDFHRHNAMRYYAV